MVTQITAAKSARLAPASIETSTGFARAELSVGKARVYYETSRPKGKPRGSVVILHELRTNREDAKPITDVLLAKGYSVTTIDAPFTGKSFTKNAHLLEGGRGVTLADEGRGIGAAMKAAGLTPPITVVGPAHGGGTGMLAIAASGLADKVKKVVLTAPFPYDLFHANIDDLYDTGANPFRAVVDTFSVVAPLPGLFAKMWLGAYETVARPVITGVAGKVARPLTLRWAEKFLREYFEERYPKNEIEPRLRATLSSVLPENTIDLDCAPYQVTKWIPRLNPKTEVIVAVGAEDEFLRRFPAMRDHMSGLIAAARRHVGAKNVTYENNIPGLGHDVIKQRPDLVIDMVTRR